MNQLAKKISILILLAVLLAPLCYPLVFKIRQHAIRQRMKEKLAKEILVHIDLPASDIIWVKPGKEIVVNGRMFDIHSLKYSNDGIVHITGLYDEEETVLKRNLRETQKKNDTQKNKQLTQLLQQILAIPSSLPATAYKFEIKSGHLYPSNDNIVPSPFKIILTPPPKS